MCARTEPTGGVLHVPGRVLKVIDGDTVWLDIDFGFRVWTRKKVRLRGIDSPELPTPEGVRAKDFVVRALSETPEAVLHEGTFLNRALLAAGLAARLRE